MDDPHCGHRSHHRKHKYPAYRLEKDRQQPQNGKNNKKQHQHQLIDFTFRALRLRLLIERLGGTGRR